jgi:orotidine-5'-phosphate decarboxylase
MAVSVTRRSYAERAKGHKIAVARTLFETIERKSTNLCVSVDVTDKASFLRIVDAVGPFCCLIKVCVLFSCLALSN